MPKILLCTYILLGSQLAFALETDNYIMWNRELEDSSEIINKYISSEINAALEKSNAKRGSQDCQDVTDVIAQRFKSFYISNNPLENWLKANLGDEYIYPRSGDYINASIYRNPFRFYIPAFGLSPNVQVNGVYFGTDKLTHFSSTGRRYLNHYQKQIQKGLTDIEARKSAILFGLKNETSILGYWSSGVYSYGDVEANYQGFLFYKQMCSNSTNNFLQKESSGKWKLQTIPDIRKFVSPYWDETYNLSYRLPANWKKVSEIIKQDYCPRVNDPAVVARMENYREYPHTSFSLKFVKELQDKRFEDAPIPEETQSFNQLCGL